MTAKATKALEDFHTITPHLTVRGVDEAITLLLPSVRCGRALSQPGSRRQERSCTPNSCSAIHVSSFTMNSPRHGEISPLGGQATGIKLHLYVEDVDDMFQRAVDLGATVNMPVQDCFWGDRTASSPTLRPPLVDCDSDRRPLAPAASKASQRIQCRASRLASKTLAESEKGDQFNESASMESLASAIVLGLVVAPAVGYSQEDQKQSRADM